MDKNTETFNTWNKVATIYQEKFFYLDIYNKTYDFTCKSINKTNAKILEVGCGPGNITKYLLTKRPDFDILGIDIAPKMIELSIKNNPTAKFLVMDGRQINQLKYKYDAIICGFFIPYLSMTEVEKLIADANQMLNSNGVIYLSFVEGDPTKSGFLTAGTGDRSYFYYHDLKKIIGSLAENKLEALKIFKVPFNKSALQIEIHTILIAKKNDSI